jgi:hypothetical protein
MSDPDPIEPSDIANAGDNAAARKNSELSGVGVVFALVGVAFLLTMDSPALGLPFVVLGIVFFGMRLRAGKATPEK